MNVDKLLKFMGFMMRLFVNTEIQMFGSILWTFLITFHFVH